MIALDRSFRFRLDLRFRGIGPGIASGILVGAPGAVVGPRMFDRDWWKGVSQGVAGNAIWAAALLVLGAALFAWQKGSFVSLVPWLVGAGLFLTALGWLLSWQLRRERMWVLPGDPSELKEPLSPGWIEAELVREGFNPEDCRLHRDSCGHSLKEAGILHRAAAQRFFAETAVRTKIAEMYPHEVGRKDRPLDPSGYCHWGAKYYRAPVADRALMEGYLRERLAAFRDLKTGKELSGKAPWPAEKEESKQSKDDENKGGLGAAGTSGDPLALALLRISFQMPVLDLPVGNPLMPHHVAAGLTRLNYGGEEATAHSKRCCELLQAVGVASVSAFELFIEQEEIRRTVETLFEDVLRRKPEQRWIHAPPSISPVELCSWGARLFVTRPEYRAQMLERMRAAILEVA